MRSLLVVVGVVLGSGLSAAMCVGGVGTEGCDFDNSSASTAAGEGTASVSGRGASAPSPSPRVDEPRATPEVPLPGDVEAEAIFAQRCILCHGPEGRGDGQAAAGLNPKPRNYTDPAWQAAATDERIEKVILEGGPAIGLSAAMPPNGDLGDKPEVIAALRRIVRKLGGK